MRKLIAALIFCLLASSSTVFAADVDTTVPFSAMAAAREPMRVDPAWNMFRQTPAAQQPEAKPWIERHPVWFGLIAGASAGAAWGALSCHDGCFPIGPGGAAMVGSWFGAGPGALIGWAVGRAK